MAKKYQNFILHLLGCLLFLSIPVLLSPDLHSNGGIINIAPFRRSFLTQILLLGFFYANYTYLIPQLYFTRRYVLFFLILAIALAIISWLPDILVPEAREQMHNMFRQRAENMPPGMPPPGDNRFFNPGPERKFFRPFFFGGSLQFFLALSLSFLLRVNKRLADIESEKLKTEVSYLRAQINPHFLFNTLNSLYALALEKSDNAAEAILKLSGMMRYVVTESSREHVALQSEINYIKNYISLQQLRMDENTTFSLKVRGDATGKQISPLLLIPFIENAFKYGLNPEKEAVIEIAIDIDENQLALYVKNNKVNVNIPEEESSGHGLENTRKRLQFLYPDKHSLTIQDNPDTFEVKLILLLI